MGKKGLGKKASNSFSGSQVTLREGSKGKKQINLSAKLSLKLEHLKNLALWATGEASIPSLGAFFGHYLATSAEALGLPPNPSFFTCQRCASILQPGNNCTIRIEKNRNKSRHRRKKTNHCPQNYVVYNCHFCLHRNLISGTPKGHMKEILPMKLKKLPKSKPINPVFQKPTECVGVKMEILRVDELGEAVLTGVDAADQKLLGSSRIEMNILQVDQGDKVVSIDGSKSNPVESSPATPPVRPTLALLEAKKRKRNRSGAKKAVEHVDGSNGVQADKASCASSKRRRRSWTSLKEIAESSDNSSGRKITNLSIPFSL